MGCCSCGSVGLNTGCLVAHSLRTAPAVVFWFLVLRLRVTLCAACNGALVALASFTRVFVFAFGMLPHAFLWLHFLIIARSFHRTRGAAFSLRALAPYWTKLHGFSCIARIISAAGVVVFCRIFYAMDAPSPFSCNIIFWITRWFALDAALGLLSDSAVPGLCAPRHRWDHFASVDKRTYLWRVLNSLRLPSALLCYHAVCCMNYVHRLRCCAAPHKRGIYRCAYGRDSFALNMDAVLRSCRLLRLRFMTSCCRWFAHFTVCARVRYQHGSSARIVFCRVSLRCAASFFAFRRTDRFRTLRRLRITNLFFACLRVLTLLRFLSLVVSRSLPRHSPLFPRFAALCCFVDARTPPLLRALWTRTFNARLHLHKKRRALPVCLPLYCLRMRSAVCTSAVLARICCCFYALLGLVLYTPLSRLRKLTAPASACRPSPAVDYGFLRGPPAFLLCAVRISAWTYTGLPFAAPPSSRAAARAARAARIAWLWRAVCASRAFSWHLVLVAFLRTALYPNLGLRVYTFCARTRAVFTEQFFFFGFASTFCVRLLRLEQRPLLRARVSFAHSNILLCARATRLLVDAYRVPRACGLPFHNGTLKRRAPNIAVLCARRFIFFATTLT